MMTEWTEMICFGCCLELNGDWLFGSMDLFTTIAQHITIIISLQMHVQTRLKTKK